jgi:hypothetical protein
MVQVDQLHQADVAWSTMEPAQFPIPAAPMPITTTPPPPQNISSTESSPSKAVWGEFMMSQSSEAGVAKAVETQMENVDLPEPAQSIEVDIASLGHLAAQEMVGVEGHMTDDMYAPAFEPQEEHHGQGAAPERPDEQAVGIRRMLSDIEEVPEEPLSPPKPIVSHSPVTSGTHPPELGIPPDITSVLPNDTPPCSSPTPPQHQLPSTVPMTQADDLQSRHSGVNPPKTRSHSLSRAPSPAGQGPITRSRSSSLLKGNRPPRSKSLSVQR